MQVRILLIVILSTFICSSTVYAQFVYNEYEEVIAFSYINPKIEKLKKRDKINSLELPSYNNDSLFWENNIQYLLPKRGKGPRTLAITRAVGFPIDTTINFFDVATKVKIKQGHVWLYKITSPTALELGVRFSNCSVDSNDYLSAHSNFTDSIHGPEEYRLPQVELGPKEWGNEERNRFGYRFVGNSLFIEYFSPHFKRDLRQIVISQIIYSYYVYYLAYRLSDAPKWIKDRYPDVDFNNACYY